ncbi:MAG TPA: AIM24 family protein [Bryobacteraceae bacterium]|jgi:uncharacterized protein (AIM24 family)|nr:AIM24 family protein [Bryobacteraceae bacterium]
MFCINCGTQLAAGSNFCTNCGQKMNTSPASAPPVVNAEPQIRQNSQSFLHPDAVQFSAPPVASQPTKCPWCVSVLPPSAGSTCPFCGASLQAHSQTTRSGWIELPPRRDMARLQIGNSSCQIEGLYVPVADMNLAAGDSVYFSHHVLLWKDTAVNMTPMSMRGGWKRMFAGLPLVMTEAQGPGHIAFSKDQPGDVIALPLHPGQSVDVREHMFLVATSNVRYDWFQSNVWYSVRNGNDTETSYPIGMFVDSFSAPSAPGLLLLHAGGSVFTRHLAPDETILIKPTAFVFKDPTVQMELHFDHPAGSVWGYRTYRCIWLRLYGPGRVAIQSVFEHMENESGNLSNYSRATSRQWY